MTTIRLYRAALAAFLLWAGISASFLSAWAADIGPLEVTHEEGLTRLMQNGPKIEIAAQFAPLSETAATPAAMPAIGLDAANQVIEQQVLGQIEAFREEYQAFLAGNDGVHIGPPWGLSITAETLYAGPVFWTIDLETYFFTGGAHGGADNQALVLHRDTGEPIPPADLFKPDSDWLQRLAEASYQVLIQREHFEPGDEWLVSGTAPEAENYQVLLPLAEGIEVVFGQYQIGPYAIGISRVLLPYSAIRTVLNPTLFPDQEP